MGEHFYAYPTVIELRRDITVAELADQRPQPALRDETPDGPQSPHRPSERPEG